VHSCSTVRLDLTCEKLLVTSLVSGSRLVERRRPLSLQRFMKIERFHAFKDLHFREKPNVPRRS
jgi:hypothetical protein